MKYMCTRTCGSYRAGHEYELESPLPVLATSAIRRGYLVAAGGWCAPSETVYSAVNAFGEELLSLPQIQTTRGGIKFDNEVGKTEAKPRRRAKKAQPKPDTLESLSEQTAKGLEDLRGPAAI